jgi:dTDP-4-dehydrorhamnose reductase
MLKILLFGKNGQLAYRLYQALLPLGEIIVYGSRDLDFRNFDQLKKCISLHKPDVIINAAAYTKVDDAESDHDNVFAINADAVKIIAEAAALINSWLIHYSTEYVFDGTKNGAYTENDTPNPLNIYGQSKLFADNYIQSISPKYIILRTSWIYDTHGKNFAKTILSLAKKNDSLRIVNDQIGAPTNAFFVANITSFIIYKILTDSNSMPQKFNGIYNLSTTGEVSWYGFAYALIKQAHESGDKLTCFLENIIPVSTANYKTTAKRPMNSKLDTSKLANKFNLVLPKWDVYIPFFS